MQLLRLRVTFTNQTEGSNDHSFLGHRIQSIVRYYLTSSVRWRSLNIYTGQEATPRHYSTRVLHVGTGKGCDRRK